MKVATMLGTSSSRISIRRQEWQTKSFEPSVKRFPERQSRFTTSSDRVEIDPVYTPDDADASDYLEQLGFPGEYPFTRGVQPNMYRGRFWTMRQYAGFGSAAESNARYHYLIERGQTGLSVAFDLPTQIGYDADHDFAEGEWARWASRSAVWRTWRPCWLASRSTKSALA